MMNVRKAVGAKESLLWLPFTLWSRLSRSRRFYWIKYHKNQVRDFGLAIEEPPKTINVSDAMAPNKQQSKS